MESIHERANRLIMYPEQKRVAANVQRAFCETQNEHDDQECPERSGKGYEYDQHTQHDNRPSHKCMTRYPVIHSPANVRAEEISQGTEEENQADLVQATG